MTETKAKRAKKEAVGAPIVAYKGFDENLQCRGFQYEVGKTYEHSGNVSICSTGFHACDNPFDVLNYYDITGRFAKVTLGGDISRENGGDTKIASGKITIEAEIKLPEFIKSAIAWVMRSAKLDDDVQAASGHSSQLAASGHYSKLAASGDSSQLEITGKNGVISASSHNCTAKGVIGTWISLPEFNDKYECIGFATGCIGQDGLVADTWYRARGGKLVAA
jgi:hypothetical protein